MTTSYHIPVMLKECLEGLSIHPSGIYVDVTFGGGGHSRAILERLNDSGRLYGFDQDADAEANTPDDKRFTLVRSNFKYLYNFLRYYEVSAIDGLLADLGVSSHHFDSQERGFSFRFESPLDMRMNNREGMTAADILNTYDEAKLSFIFAQYGELKNSRRIASAIIKARAEKSFRNNSDFIKTVEPFISKGVKQTKVLAQLFQALRIEVNDELEALRKMLEQSLQALKPGGRLVVITYHSLEDRLVKNYLKTGNFEGKEEKDFYGNLLAPFKLINNRVITPSEEELAVNTRSRSAKLRIAEKILKDERK